MRARTLKGFMLEVDEDHDGTIDFNEFFKWYVKETDENGMNAKWSRTVETRYEARIQDAEDGKNESTGSIYLGEKEFRQGG